MPDRCRGRDARRTSEESDAGGSNTLMAEFPGASRDPLDRGGEHLQSFVEIVAGIEHPVDLSVVIGPLLDLV